MKTSFVITRLTFSAVLSLFLCTFNIAGPVRLDTSFNSTGYRIQPIYFEGSIAESVAIQNDGRIVAGGWTFSTGPGDYASIRLLTNGALDTSYDTDGILTTILGPFNRGDKILIQPDGKILLSGERYSGNTNNDFAIVRYNTNGSLDNSFDGNGVAAPAINGFSDEYCRDMALQNDGKIILVGSTSPATTTGQNLPSDIAIMRLNSDGSLDATFSGGIVVIRFLNVSEAANSVVIQSDGKIVIGGFLFTGVKTDFLTMRFNQNGTIDTDFGTNGVVVQSISSENNSISSLGLQRDGKILAGGSNKVIRYNVNGTIDTTFGDNGIATPPQSQSVNKIAVLSNDKILVGGNSNARPGVSRLNPDGTVDGTFNNTGIVTATVSDTSCFVTDLSVQSDNKIVVGGSCIYNGINEFAVFRFEELSNKSPFDYDGDGKSDVSVFRPSNGTWYVSNSSNGSISGTAFGQQGDLISPADFDGDGKTDVSVFRNGNWYRLNSSTNQFVAVPFGAAGDVPAAGDFDGDGKADISVFRPSNGNWYRLNSSNGQFAATLFGQNGDKPQVGDFDGDGKTDIAVFRPSNSTWYILRSSDASVYGVYFGAGDDVPAVGDFDGDNKTDVSVFRPSNGTWYRINSSNNQFVSTAFGTAGDVPVAADYDGDAKADVAVFRPSNNVWYLQRSTAGFTGIYFGANGDVPTPSAFGQ